MQKHTFIPYHYRTFEPDDKLMAIALLTVTHSGINLPAYLIRKQVQ
ncbi:hypothetical protein [Calothrix sp. PCC 7507]|nr:hypothetical protein [Calothrix sp. PCC 7507]